MQLRPLALVLALLPALAPAADTDTQALIDELRQLSDKAREQRAADRWLQRALDDLVARYDWPWQKELVFDDFSDGDYQQHPAWQVQNGRFWVARGRGLRTRAEPGSQAGSTTGQPPSVEAAVIGALLQQALGGGDGGNSAPAAQTGATGEPAAIELRAPITNAFALEASFSLETPAGAGELAFALLQGDAGRYGYRLLLRSGTGGVAELQRIRGGRSAVVEQARLPFDPGDGAEHRLGWRQAANGDVTVELDGQSLFSVRDKAFRDGYQQLGVALAAGDLTLHSIRVSGTP